MPKRSVAVATKKQLAHGLISQFLKRYESMYGTKPTRFNRYALMHGFEALAEDYPHQAAQIIDYYFDNYLSHDPNRFVYDYGKIVEEMDNEADDAAERKRIRKQTIERMKNVRTNSSESDQGGNP